MPKILDAKGNQIKIKQQTEIEDAKFINGSRVILSIVEDEKDKTVGLTPHIKELMNPFALEKLMTEVATEISRNNMEAKFIKICDAMLQRYDQARQEKVMIAQAMKDVDLKTKN